MSDNWVLGVDFGPMDWTSYIAKAEQRMIVPDERGNRVYNSPFLNFHSIESMLLSIFEMMKSLLAPLLSN